MRVYHHRISRIACKSKTRKKATFIACSILAGASFPLAAQELSVVGNAVTVSNDPGGFGPTSVSIGSDGIVDDIVGLPDSGTLDLPSFSFTLEQDNVQDGTYTFAAGFIIDDENSGRRLEISIPEVSMNFSGGVLSGSVPAAQSITILGRSGDSITQVSTSVSNNFATFSGSFLRFNADTQLNLIQAQGDIFADVITTIDTAESGNYAYAVFLKQTGGPANLRFGTGATTASFTQFPCTNGSAFTLFGGALASIYSGAEGLQGQLQFAASNSPLAAGDPALFTPSSCAIFTPPSTGGGGGGGGTPPPEDDEIIIANDDLVDELDSLQIPTVGDIDDTLLQEINTALANTRTLAGSLVTGIVGGGTSASGALGIVNTLNRSLELAGAAIRGGAGVDQRTVRDIVVGIGQVFDALRAEASSNPTLISSIEAATITTLSRAVDLIADDADTESTAQLMKSIATALNSAKRAGAILGGALTDAAQALAEAALQKSLDNIADDLNIEATFTDSAATQDLLNQNSTLLTEVLEVTAISLLGITQLDAGLTQTTIENRGVSTDGANNLANDLSQFVIPTDLIIEIDGQSATATDLVASAIDGASGVTVDSVTGAVEIAATGGKVSALVTGIAIVAESVPSGIFTQPDGSLVNIANGVAVTLAPSPSDPIELVRAIEEVGGGNFTTDIAENGAIVLTDLNSGDVFSATFSFDGATSDVAPVETSFTVPDGDPADTDFEFTVTFEDGTVQSILPIILDPRFFDSVAAYGFDTETDRSSGIIEIGEFRFRPSFFIRPPTLSDTLFRLFNQDEHGVAYRATEVNGDGITDYEVLSAFGIQVVYGLE